jgi:polysaccharide pyruvyl transferase WcaK-like protein
LLPWCEISTAGPAQHLLIVGGGTLINRGYLRQVLEHDSPRVERVVFGTGVANPSYWGTPKEDPAGWVEFLATCGLVGVRGPTSAELLRGFGYRGGLTVIGDPALALLPPAADTMPGRVVMAPAFARGELWGGDDQAVFAALAEVTKGLVAEGREVHFLSCFPGDDRHIFEIMRRAGHPDLPYLAGYDSTDASLGLLASAEVVVAERLHAAVLAAAAGTPFVSLEYRPKLADFARSVEMERYLLRTDQVTPEAIAGLIVEVNREEGLVEQLAARVGEYRSRLKSAAQEVSDLVGPGVAEEHL